MSTTVVLGADLIAFFAAWPPGDDYYHESGFTQEGEGAVLCLLAGDEPGAAVDPAETYAVDGELFWQGKGKEPPGREHDLGRVVAAWIRSRTYGVLVAALPWEKMDEAQAAADPGRERPREQRRWPVNLDMWYEEMIDVRSGDGRKTGLGAGYKTEAEAREHFAGCKRLEVTEEGACAFLLDLHDANGDLIDTICLDATGFAEIVGTEPASVETYVAHDRTVWQEARERSKRRAAGRAAG